MVKLAQGTVFRLGISAALAVAAVALFIVNREEKKPAELQREFVLSTQAVDRGVDAVLKRFGVEPEWIQRREITDVEKQFTRIERKVTIPPEIIPAMMNRELNLIAKRFNGRAVGTENLKESTVTIHIVLQRSIVQTIILKVRSDIKRKENVEQLKKI